jgi:Lsr2
MAVDLVRCREPSAITETAMAAKITVVLEDDLEGGPAKETLRFRVGGTEYEIDLNKKNAGAFRKQLAPFVKPPARRRHPGLGQGTGHRGQRPRTDSGQRGGAATRKATTTVQSQPR